MARYQLTLPWPISDRLVPVASVIDDVNGVDDYSKLVKSKGLSPPITADPLDQGTWNAMKSLYGLVAAANFPGVLVKEDWTRYVTVGPGVVR
jgi:hypothetical protein